MLLNLFLTLFSLPFLTASEYQVDALLNFKNALKPSSNQLIDWTSARINPCTWTSITCDNENKVIRIELYQMDLSGTLSPKIGILQSLSVLSLPGNNITGTIPEEFGNLTSLTSLKLNNNHFDGKIPSSLGNLNKLQILILSENNLSGNIPDSFSNLGSLTEIGLAFNNLSGQIPDRLFQVPKYNFTGNNLNCGQNSKLSCESNISFPSGQRKSNLGAILGSVSGVVATLIFAVLVLLWRCGKANFKREVFVDVSGEDDRRLEFGQLTRFAWRQLQLATDNFSEKNLLGQGGFGKVYKGVLDDNRKIAVKRLIGHDRPGGESTFLQEVEMISVAIHRNLLRLIGFCTTPTERLLVYPFMQNLSVAYRLREIKPGEPVLDWPKRKSIALGTARGLEYLHEHCNPKIIHRDVKAANVLLDENFEAVVGDFGLAKVVDVRQTSVTTQIRGTMGHIAPEYLSTGKSSERTDVFGYGIMLLELVTGQRAVDMSRLDGEEVLLLDHVKKLQHEKRLDAVVDRNLNNNYDILEVEMMVQVALLCTHSLPDERPMMSDVVRMLEGEGLAERWEEWVQHEMNRRQEHERLQTRFEWIDESLYNQSAIELSAAR